MLLSYAPKVLCPYHSILYLNYTRRWLRAIKAAFCIFLNTVNSRIYTRIAENIQLRNVLFPSPFLFTVLEFYRNTDQHLQSCYFVAKVYQPRFERWNSQIGIRSAVASAVIQKLQKVCSNRRVNPSETRREEQQPYQFLGPELQRSAEGINRVLCVVKPETCTV